MEMILITYPEPLEGEHELIKDCFEEGLQDLHLRKYEASEQEVLDLLKRIPEKYHPRIVLHHHHYLVRSFNIKGVHFNSFSKGTTELPEKELLFSRAIHDAKALESEVMSIDRVLLSPVFPTLSKEGDRSLIPRDVIEDHVKKKSHPFELIALAGVTPDKVNELASLGFDGFAVLGGIWEPFKEEGKAKALQTFKTYQKKIDHWETGK